MTETEEHKELKLCAAKIFHGATEKAVNGRVDVRTQSFCVEVETSGRTDRIQHAIQKLSSSKCGGGFLIVPPTALDNATKVVQQSKNILIIPSDKFMKICKSTTHLQSK